MKGVMSNQYCESNRSIRSTRDQRRAHESGPGRSGRGRKSAVHPSDWRPVLTGLAPRPPNLLVVGASGHVAQAFLLRLQSRRREFGRLVLLDCNEKVLSDAYLDHTRLDYQFIRRRLGFPQDAVVFQEILRRHEIDIVLDVTDLDTMPILEATDAVGVSYVNTALNDAGQCVAEVVSTLHPTRGQERNAPHILSSGMNPGVVNIWVWDGFRRFGAPSEIIHFEYDTSMARTGWRPMVTWSRQEFLTECVWEPTGSVVNGKLEMLRTNSLENRQDMRPILEPVISLDSYPRGLLVLHEENVKLGQKLGASSKYVYAIHPRTMDYLMGLWRDRGRVEVDDLELGDNTSVPLSGSDTIGLCLKYPEQWVYYLHSLANQDVVGTNATCAQVAVGIDAALATLLSEALMPRLYFASDLYDTVYRDVVFNSLRVEQFAFDKRRRKEPLQNQAKTVAVSKTTTVKGLEFPLLLRLREGGTNHIKNKAKMKRIKNRILVASADVAFKEMVGEVLRSYGHTVLLADHGRGALQALRDQPVDAVVLDHETPFTKQASDSGNPDTLQAITDLKPFLPVILACQSRDALEHAALLMADMVLETPLMYSALLEAVETLLQETLRERAHRKAEDVRVLR